MMTRLSVAILFASTVSVVLWGIAETAANPARHSADNQDELHANHSMFESGELAHPISQGLVQVKLQADRAEALPVDVVECYGCTDCHTVNENTTSTKLCPNSNDRSKQNKCVTYAEKYKSVSKSWLVRGCASERGTCDEIKKSHSSHSDLVELEYCYECEGYLCNKNFGHRSIADITLAVLTIIICPLVAKHTLS